MKLPADVVTRSQPGSRRARSGSTWNRRYPLPRVGAPACAIAAGLVLRGGARDFHSAQPISGDLVETSSIDDHHIFPDSNLREHDAGVPARLRDCVLNRTLIDRVTNIRISNRAPSEYMAEIRGTLGAGAFGNLLDSHFIPDDATGPLWSNDFEAFLAQRQASLWAQIKAVTGLTEASDLVEDAEA